MFSCRNHKNCNTMEVSRPLHWQLTGIRCRKCGKELQSELGCLTCEIKVKNLVVVEAELKVDDGTSQVFC